MRQSSLLFSLGIAIVVATTTAQTSIAQTIVQNFPGVSLVDVNAFSKNLTPPDSMGAVGPSHYVEFVNGAFAIYTKTGTRQSIVSDNQFWSNASWPGTKPSFSGISDPRIVYDSASGRWFATEITTASTGNQVFVGRSDTSNPAGGWKALNFTGNSGFADYDTLGVDATGVYIGTNNFTSSTGSFSGVSLFSIPKSDLLTATPTLANMTKFENLDDTAYGFTLQGVNNSGPGSGHGVVIAIDNVFWKVFDRTTINGSGGAGATLSPTIKISNTYDASPPAARQPSGIPTIDALDDRFSGAVRQVGNKIYMANAIGNAGRDAVHWMVMDETTNTVFGEGLISDPNWDYFQPSIAANANGDILLGFNRSGGTGTSPAGRLSSYAAVGKTVGSTITFGSPLLLQQGPVDNFNISFGGNPQRWGDYSATQVDPIDSNLFWTIQEVPVDSTHWGTQITAVSVPEPSTIVLLGMGAIGLLGWAWRRRRHT